MPEQMTEGLVNKAIMTVALLGGPIMFFGLISGIDAVFWSGIYMLAGSVGALASWLVWGIWHD